MANKQWDNISEVADFVDQYFGVRKAIENCERRLNNMRLYLEREAGDPSRFVPLNMMAEHFYELRGKILQEQDDVVQYEFDYPTIPSRYNEFESPDATLANEMALKYPRFISLVKELEILEEYVKKVL